MRACERHLLVALLAVGLTAASLSPSFATDERVQTLNPTTTQADDIQLGLNEQGAATAVWSDAGGIRYAARPHDGEFGFTRSIRGVGLVGELAFDEGPNGNAVVAWTDLSTNDVKAASRTGSTGLFGAAQDLTGTIASGAPNFVDVAVSSSGRAVVIWEQSGSGGEPKIRVAVSDTQDKFSVAQTLDTGVDVTDSEVGIDAQGNATAVWLFDAQPGGTDEIRTAAAPASTGQFGTATTAETPGSSGGYNPEMDVNAAGATLLVYEDDEGLKARSGSTTGAFGAEQTLETTLDPIAHEVTVDDSGKAAVAFATAEGMRGQVSDAGGSFTAGDSQAIGSGSAGGQSAQEDNFELTAGSGEFTLFWAGDETGDGRNEALRSTTVDGAFGAAHQLSRSVSSTSAEDVDGARNAAGDVIGGWVFFVNGHNAAEVTPTVPDTIAPTLSGVSDSPDPFNPRRGSLTIKFKPSEEVKATVVVTSGSKTVATLMKGKLVRGGVVTSVKWNGKSGGAFVKPGKYGYKITVMDAAGNKGTKSGTVTVK